MSKHTILAVACTAVIFFCSHPLTADAKKESVLYGIIGYTEDTAREYLSNRGNDIDVIEGIWQSSDGYKYAIELDVDDNGYRKKDQFRMIVIEGESGWSGGDVRAYISRGSIDGAYSIKYYSFTADLDFVSSSLLLIVENSSLLKITQAYNGSDVVLYRLYTEGASSSSSSSPVHVGNAWSGTGVAIGGRYLVTNYHIVEGASNLVISGISNVSKTEYDVEVIATDKNNDLAILKVTDRAFGGFDIKYGCKTTTLDVGTSIYVLGYPLVATMGEDIKLTTGVISSRTGYEGDVSQYQMSAAVQPGNSGAPLFDDKGNLIGIVSSKHALAENSGYAVKLSYLKNLLESLDETISLPSTNSISSYSLPQQVKAISPCVVMVKANTKGGAGIGNCIFGPCSVRKYRIRKFCERIFAHNLFYKRTIRREPLCVQYKCFPL